MATQQSSSSPQSGAERQRTPSPGSQGGQNVSTESSSKDRPRQSSGRSLFRSGFDPILSSAFSSPFSLGPRELLGSNPFALMRRMTEEMDRVFSGLGSAWGGSTGQSQATLWSPPIEVKQRNGSYVVCAELPGLKPEDVKVEVDDNMITIEGDRKDEFEQTEGGVRRTERRYGHFYRSVPLPEGANPNEVNATFDNGVLEVTVQVPKQQSNARQIPVRASSQTGGSSGQSEGSERRS